MRKFLTQAIRFFSETNKKGVLAFAEVSCPVVLVLQAAGSSIMVAREATA